MATRPLASAITPSRISILRSRGLVRTSSQPKMKKGTNCSCSLKPAPTFSRLSVFGLKASSATTATNAIARPASGGSFHGLPL